MRAAVILFTQQPYTTDVILQHRQRFRYDIVWDKVKKIEYKNKELTFDIQVKTFHNFIANGINTKNPRTIPIKYQIAENPQR